MNIKNRLRFKQDIRRFVLFVFVCSISLLSNAQRVYINPGHGDWGPNSRPMATVNYAAYDTLGFFESNTNLWKAFALQEKLVTAGYDVMMSRTENGPYPYVYGDESIDKPLLDICAEVNIFEADYFISIHSNANVDGDNVNYPLFLYAGTDGGANNISNSYSMAQTAWPRHFEVFGNDKNWQTITHGFEPNSYYSLEEPNLRGDESFYGGNGLQVLEHSCPGYLVEGYFHTYQPARHRALNPEWCRQEGIRYFRGIQDYYRKAGENVGYIMGCVRDISEWFSHAYYTPMQSSYDPFKPINGAKVVLRDASGNIIRTECYRHVARHITDQYYYTTDHNYNGIFVFENLQPGEYTLTVHAAGYQDKEIAVTVTANKTVYPEIFLEKGQGTEPQINMDVKWVLNGGKVDGTLPSKIEDSEYTLPTPTRAGYIFLGWYANAEGTGTALETLSVGYKGTVYALWESTSVTWQLNGGKVYPDNQWLWEDFQKYFNEYYGTSKEPQPITNVLDFWTENFDTSWKMLVEDQAYTTSDYWWLGHYIWGAYNGANGTSEQWWRESLADFFNNDDPKVWREFAKEKSADSRFYTPITLPDQITSDYTIPTPEKEGFDFVGWYDNPNGEGKKLTTLPVGYNSTVYAIWQMPTLTKVVWVLNDGHVYPSNDWLWQDFCSVFNEIHSYDLNNPLDENAFLAIWTHSSNNVSDKQAYYMLIESTNPTNKRYCWLGDYLWKKTETAAGGNSDYINLSNEWWGKVIWAFFNCTTYTYDTSDGKTITVDFSVAGQPKSWRKYAIDNKDTKNIAQDFYTEITLPEEIDVDYTIPTPEKEGYTFQGWYNNHKGEGDPITVLPQGSTGMIYAIWQAPVPCIVAYDLNCNYLTGKMEFEFSFYANSLPVSGKLIFYNKDGQNTEEYQLSNLRQGKNTISIQAESLHALGLASGQDIYWDVELEARPSTLFAEIFRSQPFNTAYATIDNSPASDFFGSIWVANQLTHGYNTTTDGEIYRLVPEQGYAREGGNEAQQGHRPHRPRPGDPKPNNGGGQQPPQGGPQPSQGNQPQGGQPQPNGGGQQSPQGGKQEPPRGGRPDHTPSENTETGFEVIFRPTVAPDGTVYLTDNGKSYGGVFVMDPHTKQITNFFDGYEYANGEWKDNSSNIVGSGSTGAHIYWTEDGDNKNGFHPTTSKLFLMHNDHAENAPSYGSTKGFFVYDLMSNNKLIQDSPLKHYEDQGKFNSGTISEFVNTQITDYAIVGTNRGAWVCQLRNDKGNFFSHPSLTFYPNEGDPMPKPTIFSSSLAPSSGGIFGDNELIHGSFGAALAVNKAENLLAMVGGTGNIMLFDITWNGSVPTLSNKRDYPIVADDLSTTGEWDIPTITTLNFDYAGNLVATLGETYNDASDKHQVAIFTLPKAENKVDVPARESQFVPSLVEDEQCASVAKADMTYQTVKLYRKLQSGMYNTICLPFGIDLNNLFEDHPYKNATVVEFVGTEIQTVGGEDILKLKFSQVTSMQAGVPYLIKPQQTIKDPMLFYNVVMGNSVEAQAVTKGDITFQGVMKPTELPDPNMLMLVANNRLASSTGGTMQGNRGYFVIDNPQNMPKRAEIAIVNGAPSSDDYIHIDDYQPTVTKVLENGVILIIRDGVKYNLMGARVR